MAMMQWFTIEDRGFHGTDRTNQITLPKPVEPNVVGFAFYNICKPNNKFYLDCMFSQDQ